MPDDSPLAQRPGVPDASLCESGDAGHRRATTMGDDFLKVGNALRAEACYLGALHYKSDFPMALYGLGEVHSAEGRDGLAREAYQLAVDVWPVYVDAHIALGDLHHRNGRRKKADGEGKKADDVADMSEAMSNARACMVGRCKLDPSLKAPGFKVITVLSNLNLVSELAPLQHGRGSLSRGWVGGS